MNTSVPCARNTKPSQGGGRMVLVFPGSSAGTVWLTLLNLLQAVVIVADRSLLRVTNPEKAPVQDHHGSYSARLSTAGMTTELARDGHWEGSSQSGNSVATPWNVWERTRAVFQRLLSGWSSGAEGTLIPRWLEENPEREEGLMPQLGHDWKQTEPWCCCRCSLCGTTSASVGMHRNSVCSGPAWLDLQIQAFEFCWVCITC